MSKGAETRQRIIEKSAQLFNRKGYEGCSMQDIVEATGLEKASIYRYFPTKELLAAEAFDYAWQDTCLRRSHRLTKIANSVDRLKLHIENFISAPSFPGGCPLLNTALDNDDDGSPVLRARARRALQNWQNLLGGILTEGREKGEIEDRIDPDEAASLIISLLEGAAAISRMEKRHRALRAAREHLDAWLESSVRRRA
ncbi:TetR/AcrR family transcriptional regulator [Paracidobacterium acidisoli]|uniref:TetR/AcrR family transcriptional regulator n=1 Tax=Paracidobacterium acidisoli TaxID=2303751 RepID=A0A372INF1_9BACT|nr:TetR/AcrR family transcriptional regulator [Paracidobacterium acidisoli]MBT9331926.1 TetR/AcrR family transcriptional regulator [Paracidobacterium acidisoli]